MLAGLGARLGKAAAKLGVILLAAWFLIRHGKQEARRKMAEKSLRRAQDANEIDGRVRGAAVDGLAQRLRDSEQ